MDLVQTVRKEGSRGGRGEFSWDDVKNSQHRDHYLGHSLMAPVGRWQNGRDLNWYSKTGSSADDEAAKHDEFRKVKNAEEDAMARALGLPPPVRSAPPPAANESGITSEGGAKESHHEQVPHSKPSKPREHEHHGHHRHRPRRRRSRSRSRSRSREYRRRDRTHRSRSRSPERRVRGDEEHRHGRRHGEPGRHSRHHGSDRRAHSRSRSRSRSRGRHHRRD